MSIMSPVVFAALQGPPPMPQIPFEVVLIVREVFTSIVIIALGIPVIRALSRRFLAPRPVAPALPAEVMQRLERIEQAVDSIAIEVERVSESQRFTTKLLTDRGAAPVLGSGGKSPS